jgi:hypothetical protein
MKADAELSSNLAAVIINEILGGLPVGGTHGSGD